MNRTAIQPSGSRRRRLRSTARPTRLPVVEGAVLVVAMFTALYAIFLYAPREAVQGEVQRIFYVHLSLAWLAYLAFAVVLVASVAYLWRGGARWDRLGRASAEIGVLFTTLVLLTGSLWGRAVWGVWWTWDARLTTTLVLWFIYVGYLMVREAFPESGRGARAAAVVGIIGFVDVPISYLAVSWWRTLHPEPTVVRAEGPALPSEMLAALVVALAAFTVLYVVLLRLRLGLQEVKERVWELRREQVMY